MLDGLDGLKILVVEDELLVALGIQDMLREFGCEVVGPLARLHEALGAARSGTFDGVILDVNLRGEPAYPVAEILRDRGIPFVFSTGYGSGATALEGFSNVVVLEKPFEPSGLHAALKQAIRRDGGP